MASKQPRQVFSSNQRQRRITNKRPSVNSISRFSNPNLGLTHDGIALNSESKARRENNEHKLMMCSNPSHINMNIEEVFQASPESNCNQHVNGIQDLIDPFFDKFENTQNMRSTSGSNNSFVYKDNRHRRNPTATFKSRKQRSDFLASEMLTSMNSI